MNKCVISTLKAGVSNNKLQPLHGISIIFNRKDSPNNNTQTLKLTTKTRVIVSLIGDGYIYKGTYNEQSENSGKLLEIAANSTFIGGVSNCDCQVIISDKIGITNISFGGKCDISNLAYTSLIAPSFAYSDIYGDISSLKRLSSIKQFSAYQCKSLEGNFEDLANNIELTSFYVYSSFLIYGDLLNFAKAQIKLGRDNAQISSKFLNDSGLSFNGNSIRVVPGGNYILSWEKVGDSSYSISLNDDTVLYNSAEG